MLPRSMGLGEIPGVDGMLSGGPSQAAAVADRISSSAPRGRPRCLPYLNSAPPIFLLLRSGRIGGWKLAGLMGWGGWLTLSMSN